MDVKIEVLLEEDEKFSSYLHEKIKEYNNEHSIHHKEVRKKEAVQPINIIVSDLDGVCIGGLHADVYWDWVEINDLWFCKEYRGRGLGSTILNKAEKTAKEKGAKKALLTTFEFQARAFYESKGYEIVGEVKDYPPGSSFYTMVKTLL
ncbi:GNAT superfamily N-acetyltransferase [Bacillus mesophilus]|uniref:GNAT family N-acetyltransferase n=1 Tax=Bacillus mesophilus TaxID=1808955 RepID=A0A6M0QCG0_9BACI|nr:GNAT family N-acetyltransferase [Bacillus mesophilus]MBM7663224.1 GNAT superfamily N-acetyltransferase [Bacillus mesophilus]NEY73937.1 GNAT family N-acetyltransferase [Bacillus mesophilus]